MVMRGLVRGERAPCLVPPPILPSIAPHSVGLFLEEEVWGWGWAFPLGEHQRCQSRVGVLQDASGEPLIHVWNQFAP